MLSSIEPRSNRASACTFAICSVRLRRRLSSCAPTACWVAPRVAADALARNDVQHVSALDDLAFCNAPSLQRSRTAGYARRSRSARVTRRPRNVRCVGVRSEVGKAAQGGSDRREARAQDAERCGSDDHDSPQISSCVALRPLRVETAALRSIEPPSRSSPSRMLALAAKHAATSHSRRNTRERFAARIRAANALVRVPPPQWGTESVTSLRTASLLQARLDEFVARVQAETRVPGIGVGVSVAGRRFYACAGTRAVGESQPLTSETRFHLGCAGKLLLAMRRSGAREARSGRHDSRDRRILARAARLAAWRRRARIASAVAHERLSRHEHPRRRRCDR